MDFTCGYCGFETKNFDEAKEHHEHNLKVIDGRERRIEELQREVNHALGDLTDLQEADIDLAYQVLDATGYEDEEAE